MILDDGNPLRSRLPTRWLVLFAVTLLSCVGNAPGAAAATPTYGLEQKLEYLQADDLNPAKLLPSPPSDDSVMQQADMADLKRVIMTRTARRFAQAQWDNDHEDPTFVEQAIGPSFRLNSLPKTAALLQGAVNDVHVAVFLAKRHFRRRFAVVLDPTLISFNCDPVAVRREDSMPGGRVRASYPSGHASLGYAVAIVLADLIPEKSQAIMSRALSYAYSREVCGEHYRDDVEASHALGTAVGVMLLHNVAFIDRFKLAKAELRSAHFTH